MKLIFKKITRTIFALCIVICANHAWADLPLCPPDSWGQAVYFPNPDNSFMFYECDNGNLLALCCPEGLHFCSEKSACTWEWDSECAFSDTTFLDGDEATDAGYSCGYTGGSSGGGTCSCKTGTTSTETINIYGGIKKTITTQKYCSGTGSCTSCYSSCNNAVSYSCECNSGYTVSNQGKSSCNCIQCPSGSYVGGTLAAPSCVACPKNDDIAQTVGSSVANNVSTSPTSCYLPKDTTYTDTTGGYSFSSQCDYGL